MPDDHLLPVPYDRRAEVLTPRDLSHLRELFDLRLGEMEKRFVEREDSREKALALQAEEYERRLDGLNNENERILDAQSKSVSLEKFEAEEDKTSKELNRIAALQNKMLGGIALLTAVGIANAFKAFTGG